jgi:hypothetical protein
MSEHILVIANDAGGANLLASWCAENPQHRFTFCLTGPAKNLFRQTLGDVTIRSFTELDEIMTVVDRVACATSRDSTLVVAAIRRARSAHVLSVALLDHWANYHLRFGGPDSFLDNLPDELWVFDEYALAIAVEQDFPSSIIKQLPNPYLSRIVRDFELLRAGSNAETSILFLSEPVVQIQKYEGRPLDEHGYSEYQLLEDVVEVVGQVTDKPLVIRLHPRENDEKYESVLSRFPTTRRIETSIGSDLTEDLVRSSLVIGSNSTALVIAAQAGIKTISYIPAGGRPCVLPHGNIQKIRTKSALVEEVSRTIS